MQKNKKAALRKNGILNAKEDEQEYRYSPRQSDNVPYNLHFKTNMSQVYSQSQDRYRCTSMLNTPYSLQKDISPQNQTTLAPPTRHTKPTGKTSIGHDGYHQKFFRQIILDIHHTKRRQVKPYKILHI